jgi:2-keto-3-deoxy-L-rhamnonate aldolase RhmA
VGGHFVAVGTDANLLMRGADALCARFRTGYGA